MSKTLIHVDSFDILSSAGTRWDKYGQDPTSFANGTARVPGALNLAYGITPGPTGFGTWNFFALHPYQVNYPTMPPAAYIAHVDVAPLNPNPAGTGSAIAFFTYGDHSSALNFQFALYVNGSNHYALQVLIGGVFTDVWVDSATVVWQDGSSTSLSYDNFQIRYTESSASNISLAKNGTTVFTGGPYNLTQFSGPYTVSLFFSNIGTTPDFAFDNYILWSCNTSGEAFPGPQHVYALEMASVATAFPDWAFAGVNATSLLDAVSTQMGVAHDSNLSYVSPNSASPLDYNPQTTAVTPSLGVAINIHGSGNGAGNVIKARFDLTDLTSSPALPTSFWPGIQWCLSVNPNTGMPFTLSDINGGTFGFKSSTGLANITHIYLELVVPVAGTNVTQNRTISGAYSIAGNTLTTKTISGSYSITTSITPPPVPGAPGLKCNPLGGTLLSS